MPPSDGIPLQDRSRWSRKCPRVPRERSPSLGYVSNVPLVIPRSASEAAVEPFGGPAFEPLSSREARSLVPSRGRILFGVSPFPGPCCKRERKRKKGKGCEIERRGVPFLARLLRRRRSVARFSCQRRRLSRRGVNATGRVVGGAAVARARAVRGTDHGRIVFMP
jgi:hypothetical protein